MSLRTQSSKIVVRNRPNASGSTVRSVTRLPSSTYNGRFFFDLSPVFHPMLAIDNIVSVVRSTIGMNWMNCTPMASRKNRYSSRP